MSLHVVAAIALAFVVAFSAIAKLRGDRRVIRSVHDVAGVPMRWFPWLAACELAGAAGLVLGLAWRPIGVAASVGLVAYFVGAVAAHIRVGDYQGVGPASFILALAVGALATRLMGV
jgi:hypothetical protein